MIPFLIGGSVLREAARRAAVMLLAGVLARAGERLLYGPEN